MVIIVNTSAGGGRGFRRWTAVRANMDASGRSGTAFLNRTKAELEEIVRTRFSRGERTFIAAGGDGTVYCMVNTLADLANHGSLSNVSIGAVGLGSSNDFHKPLRSCSKVHGVPVAIDASRLRARDAVAVTISSDGTSRTRWFLSNGGFGVTASANARFNGGGAAARILKRISTPGAILAAIVRTLLTLRDIRLTVASADGSSRTLPVTNLSVLGSRWVSGALAFPEAWTARGMMGVVLLTRSTRISLLGFLARLLRGRCATSDHCSHFLTPELTVSSDLPVDLELDGEIVRGCRFEFSVYRDFLRVCS
jgi:diacylglycerol kinase family enzyme